MHNSQCTSHNAQLYSNVIEIVYCFAQSVYYKMDMHLFGMLSNSTRNHNNKISFVNKIFGKILDKGGLIL